MLASLVNSVAPNLERFLLYWIALVVVFLNACCAWDGTAPPCARIWARRKLRSAPNGNGTLLITAFAVFVA